MKRIPESAGPGFLKKNVGSEFPGFAPNPGATARTNKAMFLYFQFTKGFNASSVPK